jgi:SAM-dependent methyltransferase
MPIAEADPARVLAVAQLFGVQVPERWRVLEIGCGAGGHLVPLAARHPDDRWVGFDRATVPVQQARGLAEQLGAPVEVVQLDLAEAVDALAGEGRPEAYDLIVAHGVYSWVPQTVQKAFFEVLERWLAPRGVAYLSVNCLPGWGLRGTLGAMLRYVAGDGPAQQQLGRARAFTALLAELVPESDPYGAWLRREAKLVAEQSDSWVFHDLLAPTNHPVWLHELVSTAEGHGLQYLGDAKLEAMLPDRLPADVQARLASLGGGQVQQEQLLDFVLARSFRRVLLCRQQLTLTRELGPEVLEGLWVRGQLVGEGKGRFRSLQGDELTTESPLLQEIFGALAQRRPECLSVAELDALGAAAGAGDKVRRNLLLAASRGLVELRARPDGLVGRPGVRPVAEPVAAALASGGVVPSALCQRVRLDELERAMLPLLDGTRDVAALVQALVEGGFSVRTRGGGPVSARALQGWLEVEVPQRLRGMGRSGLLVG